MLWLLDSLVFSEFAQYEYAFGSSPSAASQLFFNSSSHPLAERPCLRSAGGLAISVAPPPATLAVHDVLFGMWIRVDNLSPSTSDELILARTVNVSLQVEVTATIVRSGDGWAVRFSGVRTFGQTPILAEGVWYFLEIRIDHHATNGRVWAAIDGTTAFLESGLQTYATPPVGAAINRVEFPLDPSTYVIDFADLYVCDTLGAGPYNAFVGPFSGHVAVATSIDRITEWDPEPGAEDLQDFLDSAVVGVDMSASAAAELDAGFEQPMIHAGICSAVRKAAYSEASGNDMSLDIGALVFPNLPTPETAECDRETLETLEAPEDALSGIITLRLQ